MQFLNLLKLYGTRGRVISACGVIVAVITSFQIGGAFNLIPAKLAAFLVSVSVIAASLSERLQGGASNPGVRRAAENSDRKAAIKELNR